MLRLLQIAALTAALVGCSASSSNSAGSRAPTRTAAPPTRSAAPAPSSGEPGVVRYVGQVDALCADLLPKILRVTHGGDPAKFTVAQFLAHVPAHHRLVRSFDRAFAAIAVPAGAREAHDAMRAYIDYASDIDRKRLAAARRGQRAFEREVRTEVREFPNDPAKLRRDAAGFSEACDAR